MVSTDSSHTEGQTVEYDTQEYWALFMAGEVIVYMRKFILCPFGVACNVLALVVFYRRPIKHCSLTAYLIAMACADIVYLMSDTINHIVKLTKSTTSLYCKVAHYVAMVSSTCSDTLVASVAVHRAVAVSYPHRINDIMTSRKCAVAIGSVIAFAVCLYLYDFWLYTYDEPSGWCRYTREVLQQADALILLVRSLLTLVIIVISSVIIIVRLREQRQLRRNMTINQEGMEQRDAQIGHLLLSVSALYLVTNLPLAVFLLIRSIYPWQNINAFTATLSEFLHIIFYTLKNFSNALNFFIYCHTASGFREELATMLKCRPRCQQYSCMFYCHRPCDCSGPCRKQIYIIQ